MRRCCGASPHAGAKEFTRGSPRPNRGFATERILGGTKNDCDFFARLIDQPTLVTRRFGFENDAENGSTRTPRWIAPTNRLERYGQTSGASRARATKARRLHRRDAHRRVRAYTDTMAASLTFRAAVAAPAKMFASKTTVSASAKVRHAARASADRAPPLAAILQSCITRAARRERQMQATRAAAPASGGCFLAAPRIAPRPRRVGHATAWPRRRARRDIPRRVPPIATRGRRETTIRPVANRRTKISLPASGTVASGVRLVLSLRVFFAISPSRVVLVVAADPSTRPSLPFARPAARSPRQRSRSSARRRPPPPRRLRSSP